MEITKSQIEDRKAELERNRETIRVDADAAFAKAQADINAHNGAIEDCDFWLSVTNTVEDDESEATSQNDEEGLDHVV